jgi:transcriptional regulator with XRE-family HTH domain
MIQVTPELLKQIRVSANMSQNGMAAVLGVTQSLIALQEKGDRRVTEEQSRLINDLFTTEYVHHCQQYLRKMSELRSGL